PHWETRKAARAASGRSSASSASLRTCLNRSASTTASGRGQGPLLQPVREEAADAIAVGGDALLAGARRGPLLHVRPHVVREVGVRVGQGRGGGAGGLEGHVVGHQGGRALVFVMAPHAFEQEVDYVLGGRARRGLLHVRPAHEGEGPREGL